METSGAGDFVGRAAELAAGSGLLRRAREGAGGVLVVGGEAGVGKTRLAEALADEARDLGFRVAGGTCIRVNADPIPYGGIAGALRALVRETDPGIVAQALGPYRREVARLVPEAARLGAPAPARLAATEAPAAAVAPVGSAISATTAGDTDPLIRLRLFEAVVGCLERLAAAVPIMIVVEDAHSADPATLDLLRSIALASVAERLVIVVLIRTDETAAPGVRSMVAELDRDGAERIELEPFDRATLADLVERRAPGTEADVVDRLLLRSGGNPFLAVELLEAGRAGDALPASLRDVLEARLVTLDETTLDVLRAGSLSAGPLDDARLARVLGRPLDAVGDAIRAAQGAGVLVADRSTPGGGPRFRHAIQRDVIAAQLGPGERRSLHARLADALEAEPGDEADPLRCSAIASHRDAAGDRPGALVAHIAALEAAERAFAFEAAVGHARRAAELAAGVDATSGPRLADPVELLERAALDAQLAGDPAASIELARAGLAAAGADGAQAGALRVRLRWGLWEAGHHDEARREAEAEAEASGLDPASAGTREAARLLAELAATRMADADPAPALALAGRAIELAATLGAPDTEALALGVRGRTLALHGRVSEGIADLRGGLAIAERLGSLQGIASGRAAIVEMLARAGLFSEAIEEADHGLEAASRIGLLRSLGPLLAAEAARACQSTGRWDEAERRVRDGLALRPAIVAEARLRAVALRVVAARGRWAEAAAHAARLGAVEPSLTDPEDLGVIDVGRAELALLTGRPGDVRPYADRALRLVSGAAEPGPALAWLGALGIQAEAELLAWARATGDEAAAGEATARAASLVDAIEREAGGRGKAWGARARALLAHVRGEASRIDGSPAGREAAWARAIDAWLAIGLPYPAAYARLRLAEARLAAGASRIAIAEPLRDAAATFRGLGAVPLLAHAERLGRLARIDLDHAGGAGPEAGGAADQNPDRDPLATLGLTAREREVLRLVAAGRSNARIAEALGIAAKTASVHVSNILAKLGAQNRVEAAAIAHRLGVVGSRGHPGGTRPR